MPVSSLGEEAAKVTGILCANSLTNATTAVSLQRGIFSRQRGEGRYTGRCGAAVARTVLSVNCQRLGGQLILREPSPEQLITELSPCFDNASATFEQFRGQKGQLISHTASSRPLRAAQMEKGVRGLPRKKRQADSQLRCLLSQTLPLMLHFSQAFLSAKYGKNIRVNTSTESVNVDPVFVLTLLGNTGF